MLIDGDRRYIVQTLATVLMTHIQRPSLSHCDSVAKSLISVHNFLKDEEGDDGEVLMNTYRVNCNNYPCAVCARVMRSCPSICVCVFVCRQKTRLFASYSSKISTKTLSAASSLNL